MYNKKVKQKTKIMRSYNNLVSYLLIALAILCMVVLAQSQGTQQEKSKEMEKVETVEVDSTSAVGQKPYTA